MLICISRLYLALILHYMAGSGHCCPHCFHLTLLFFHGLARPLSSSYGADYRGAKRSLAHLNKAWPPPKKIKI